MKGFFESVPDSIEEQARVDGAGTWRIFFSIILPMSVPAMVTITILSFQGSWNELSHFIVASRSPELVTLTKGVAQLSAGSLGQGNQYPLKLGAALIMTVPVAVLFFVFQRRIMDTTGGAVKEQPEPPLREIGRCGTRDRLLWHARSVALAREIGRRCQQDPSRTVRAGPDIHVTHVTARCTGSGRRPLDPPLTPMTRLVHDDAA